MSTVGHRTGARIVVIEDNPANLELMRYVLGAFGHQVVAAQDGEGGIAAVLREEPDLVICDLQLPGIDGIEVARRLKADAAFRHIPLIAVTAFAMVGDRSRVLAAGFDGYIPKPIEPQAFIAQIDQFLLGAKRSRKGGGASTSSASAATSGEAGRRRGAGRTVLVLDDTKANRDLLEVILASEGYGVLCAQDLPEAKALAAARAPDLFISDLHVGRESGLDFMRWTRSTPAMASTPFMLVSSTALAEKDRRSSLDWGADRFVLRPIEPQALLDEIAACLIAGRS